MGTVGSTITMPFSVKDPTTGLAADSGTQAITITQPDGASASPLSIAHAGTGSYVGYFVPTQAGRHVWKATTTAPVTAYGPDTFNVTAVTDGPIVGLAEARSHLNVGSAATDDELLTFCHRASDIVEAWVGKVFRRTTVTELYDGGRIGLLLRTLPVQSKSDITSVVEFGQTLASSSFVLDANAGILYRGTTLVKIRWLPGVQNISVTYSAQPAGGIVDDGVILANLELIRHLWETQRGASGRPRQGADMEYDPRSGYSLPRRVTELLDPHQAPGIA